MLLTLKVSGIERNQLYNVRLECITDIRKAAYKAHQEISILMHDKVISISTSELQNQLLHSIQPFGALSQLIILKSLSTKSFHLFLYFRYQELDDAKYTIEKSPKALRKANINLGFLTGSPQRHRYGVLFVTAQREQLEQLAKEHLGEDFWKRYQRLRIRAIM